MDTFTLEMPTDLLFADQDGNHSKIHSPSRYLLPLFRSLHHFRYATRDTYCILKDLLPKLAKDKQLETIALDFPNIPLKFESEIKKVFDRYLAGTTKKPFGMPIPLCNKVILFSEGMYRSGELLLKKLFPALRFLHCDANFSLDHLRVIHTHYREATHLAISLKSHQLTMERFRFGNDFTINSILHLNLHWLHEEQEKLFEWLPTTEPVLRALPCLQNIKLMQLLAFEPEEKGSSWLHSEIEKASTYLKFCRQNFCPDLATMCVVIYYQIRGFLIKVHVSKASLLD